MTLQNINNIYLKVKNYIKKYNLVMLLFVLSCCNVSDINEVSTYPNKSDMLNYVTKESDLTSIEDELFILFNQYRTTLNLNTLKTDVLCRDLSEGHCEYMVEKGVASHDNTFIRKFEVLRRYGLNYGEIVGKGYSTANTLFNAFISSESHREMIEFDDYTHIGIRIIEDKDGKYYVTCIFTKFL